MRQLGRVLVVELFEWDAGSYDALPLPHKRWGPSAIARLRLAGDETVADIGAGTGRDAQQLLEVLPRGPGTRHRRLAADARATARAAGRAAGPGPGAAGRSARAAAGTGAGGRGAECGHAALAAGPRAGLQVGGRDTPARRPVRGRGGRGRQHRLGPGGPGRAGGRRRERHLELRGGGRDPRTPGRRRFHRHRGRPGAGPGAARIGGPVRGVPGHRHPRRAPARPAARRAPSVRAGGGGAGARARGRLRPAADPRRPAPPGPPDRAAGEQVFRWVEGLLPGPRGVAHNRQHYVVPG